MPVSRLAANSFLRLKTLACMISMAQSRRSDTEKDGNACELICDFIAGCDGFHGICRPSIPSGVLDGV